nr:MAG TPA: hypothetical protein [Caudoviricetes sp.]
MRRSPQLRNEQSAKVNLTLIYYNIFVKFSKIY